MPVTASVPIPPPRGEGRLPPEVRPTRYALDLTIDPAKPTFTGRTRIGVKLAVEARAIVLHGRDLTIRSVVAETVRGKVAGKAQSRLAFGATDVADELVLEFDQTISVGDAVLDLAYEARFPEQLRGLYRTEEGSARYAFTQFEPIDARRAFPCFDEPSNKTPFEVTLRVPKGSTAFANGREKRHADDPGSGLVVFEFEPTPPLSTYFVAFAVGPLEVLEGPRSPVPLRVVTVPGKAALGKMALDTAAALLELYAKYLDQPYPYEKLDIVAVPNFEEGGMENAGLITFREDILLGEGASEFERRELAIGLAHELGHQWFGDLVTMKWWDETWLKESFTEWLSRKIVDQWKPEMKAELDLVVMKSRAMSQDALPAARTIHRPVRTAKEITAYTDLVFGKGAPLVGMVEAWLGEDVFRDGIRRYMKAHRNGTVSAPDLYQALGEASGVREVGKVFDAYVDNSGVPVITAQLVCKRNASDTGGPFLRLSQAEYRSLDRSDPKDRSWPIPVCARYDNAGKPATACTLLEGADGRIDLPVARGGSTPCPAFVYPNAGEVGYYRIRPARADLDRVAAQSLGKLSEGERLGFLSNAWAAVWSGHLGASDYLEHLGRYKTEPSAFVTGLILRSLNEASRLVSDTARPAFARYVRDFLGPTGRRLGWTPKKGEPEDTKLMRPSVLGTLAFLGEDATVIAEASRTAETWLADPAKVNPDMAYLALDIRGRKNEPAMFDRLLALVRESKAPDVRKLALDGLTTFTAPSLTERALDLTLDGTLKGQDLRVVLWPLSRKKATATATFAWVEKHFDAITKASSMVPVVLARMPAAACDRDFVRTLAAFLRPRLEKLGTAAELDESIETGLRCAVLAEKERGPTSAWLLAHWGGR